MKFKQLNLFDVKRTEEYALAVIDFEPEAIEQTTDIEFSKDFDNLDWYLNAGFKFKDGMVFELRRHRGSPAPGSVVYINKDNAPSWSQERLLEYLSHLGLEDAKITWWNTHHEQ